MPRVSLLAWHWRACSTVWELLCLREIALLRLPSRSPPPALPHRADTRLQLDLSPSLPYTLVSLRSHLLSQLAELEARVRSLYPAADGPSLAASFLAQASALRNDVRRLGTFLPRVPAALTLPQVPSLPAAPTWDMAELAAAWETLSFQLPSGGGDMLASLRARFEGCQDAYAALTLPDFFGASTRAAFDEGMMSPAAAHFEALVAKVKATGEDVRAKGHARASSVAKAARDAEDRLYQAALELAGQGQKLIRYEHLPELWKNNSHILSGYRFIPKSNLSALLRSTFQIHNETGNIHSHLLGAIIILPLFWPSKGLDPDTTPMDRLVQTVYLVAALKCLVLSVSWHVMAGCADACWFERFACVDYTGIAWLVAASVWTLVYNGFYCQPNLALFYSITTFLVGLMGATVPWAAWFNQRQNKGLRICVFLAMCFTGLAPFTHAAYEHGLLKTVLFFQPIVPSLLCYIGGLVFYAFQFPESIAPGRFDTWGHAHQIWHLAIVGAILLHYRAALIFHENRFDFSCAATPSPTLSTHASALLEAAGGLTGIYGLGAADDRVLGWRRAIGRLGNGAVGTAWNRLVDWTQTW
ncbi:HlyIII-domain-containing protein [Tilletiopsis washingtonensis]|uniref:HlyIII-domain-containing protein n=1 Tax=Tilletiopsis washingtonensis TaxID=58919 RepID=A0A316ZLY0_9BASI|nr:HlyIII-domain-containing protein [Tilletiopsis washingtonensis]PWO01354.1 HlyIII-domain-containing protein [Tilletiopsis washingtonensis]